MRTALATKREKERRAATAFHEAGHAVVSIIRRRRFEHVTIREDENSLGHVLGDREALRRRLQLHAEGYVDVTEVCINVAGVVAERRLTGRNNHRGAHSDYQNAVDVARGAGEDGCGAPENDPIVQAIVRGAFKQVEVIFDVQWPFVKAVAADLLTRETLTYEEVEAIRMRGDVDQRVQRLLLRRLKAADREMKRQVARMMREGKWD